ncbi:MAG: 30S ribosomal protein S12 methylthiotransferase RimO [Oscillospiraceae bacterium]|nr:30S ribosomal protein S12 methylthiotransferase RimO [Oscillospiraceae bacterium]
MAITVGMISLGCPKNQIDAEIMLADLKKMGFELVGDAALAEVCIINTCGFIESAKRESIEQILEMGLLKNEGRIKKIVVTGCLAERYKEEIAKEIPEADIILGIGSNSELGDAILKSFEDDKRYTSFDEKEKLCLDGDRVLTTLPFYAYIKIAEGCDNNCTYCAIPSIRGRFRSRRMEDIVSEAKSLAKSGVKELVVVAQDTTRYGIDLYNKPSLAELLEKLNEIDELKWIRVLYAYPEMVTDELIDAMARLTKVVKYLDLPIQHCSRNVLKRMNRRGDSESLINLINKMRDKIPNLILRTTLIAGFPGESEEDFCELCEFVKKARFDRLGCFSYSREEGTPAAEFDDQIDEDVKERRAEIIMTIQSRIAEELNEKMVGKTLEVVVEGFDKYGEIYFGRSVNDAPDIDGKIFFSAKGKRIGDFLNVKITEAMDYDLLGEEAN